jgi:hypothetical protein
MEQISNAAALEQLGYGHTMFDLKSAVIEDWLHNPHAIRVTYPNIAKVIVQWLQAGMPKMDKDYTEQVWEAVEVLQIKH